MDKNEIVNLVSDAVSRKIVNKNDLEVAYDKGMAIVADGKRDAVMTKKLSAEEILYYIGGAIVFLGIDILLWQNWSTLSFFTKMLATLGSGVAAYFIGIMLSRYEKLDAAGSAFYLIFALITPVGLYIMLDNAGFPMSDASTVSLVAGAMVAVCLASFYVLKKNVFILFSIIFGTALFFSMTQDMFGDYMNDAETEFYAWRMMTVGVIYIALGRWFVNTVRKSLVGFLNGFGIIFLLGGVMTMGGNDTVMDKIWSWVAPFASLAAIFLSTRFSSKAFLTLGTLFLVLSIFRITADFFANSIGWPLALVLAGIMMMGAGYLYFHLRKSQGRL